ncbi:MAG: purine-nucleoside phosphorylase [Actinomycetia bacterium]|nr:purine-nucleoside phosphorylase [Actinomycetes bacterium]
MDPQAKLETVASQFKEIIGHDAELPHVALVLGSGLGALAEEVEASMTIPFSDIEHFPVSSAPGHVGRFVLGKLGGVPIIVMQGRVHYYEGYDIPDVVLPMRLLAHLGVETFILTNACGGIQDGMRPGDLMLITDHIASFILSPLRGPNIDEWGVRFPDMTHVYDHKMQETIREAAKSVGIDLKEGVYLQVPGPAFETPAEVRAYKILGADVAGMSTAAEAIALHHFGARVAGISCVTNLAAGLGSRLLTSEEVNEVGERVSHKFAELIAETLKRMG